MPVFRERLVVIAPKEITAIKKPGDIRAMTVIAFGVGCSYRRTLEEWLARSKITPERVLEFGSYHAIVACVAAGSGIALVPHSVVHAFARGARGEHFAATKPLLELFFTF